MHGATGPLKYTTYDDRPGSTHNLVLGFVPRGAHVLEIGCATGYMSEMLRERLGCTVVALEIDPAAAAEAVGRADRVVVGDAEALDWSEHFAGETFDAVVFADVLEHLRDPAAVLEAVRPLLVEGGAVVASVPNIAHISVRLALLGGEFQYQQTGLLDETHLRFFTRQSLQDLFEGSGFVPVRWLRTRRSLEESEVAVPLRALDAAAVALASSDPEATTYQFVIRAIPGDHATLLAELSAARADEARTHADSTRQLSEALSERESALDEALRELGDVRTELVGAQGDLRERDDEIDALKDEIEGLASMRSALDADLAVARETLDRSPVIQARRALALRYSRLRAAYTRLRHRVR